MKRGIVLGLLLAVGALSLGAATSAQQEEMVVDVEQLQDNLYVLRGGGGNSAAFVTSDGVVLVDTKVPGWGQPLIDKIAELTPNPVTTIINTHTHFDHVSGNVEFPATVEVVAHENTQRLMGEWNDITGLGFAGEDVFAASNGVGIANLTFSDRMTLGSGSDQVDVYYFGRGHTGSDAWVVFPALRTAHSGDMFASKGLPLLDAANGGSGVDFPVTLDNAHTTLTEIDTIITGHSGQMTPDDLREFAGFMHELVGAVRAAKEAGQTADQFAAAWELPSRYAGYAAPMPERLAAAAQVIYDELP